MVVLSMTVRVQLTVGVIIPSAKQPEHCHEYVTLMLVLVGKGSAVQFNVKIISNCVKWRIWESHYSNIVLSIHTYTTTVLYCKSGLSILISCTIYLQACT